MPVQMTMLQMLTASFVSRALAVAAELSLPDRLSRKPSTVEELAQVVEADAPSLRRLLRMLASVGVFAENEHGQFSGTELSDLLRRDAPGSLRSMALFLCGPAHWSAWGELSYSLRTGRSAFERVHGSPPFDYMRQDGEFAAVFNDAMTRMTEEEVASILEHLDLRDARVLVDVGGGHGRLLTSCLQAFPKSRGILFDSPEVISQARAAIAGSPTASRCELVEGDFFTSVPAGGDVYLMKYILHDWSDGEASAILRQVHRAARKGARLYIMDPVLREGNTPDFAKLLNLQTLVFYGGGRERTLAEFTDVLHASGFRFTRAVPTNSVVTIVEAVRD
jgi:precorrin-6B methylase 2